MGNGDVSTPTGVKEMLSAERLHSGSALVTGGFVQQRKKATAGSSV